MKSKHLRYNIYSFSYERLLLNGRVRGKELYLDSSATELSYASFDSPMQAKPDSFLFYQARLITKDLKISTPSNIESVGSASNRFLEVFIDVDFTNIMSNFSWLKLINDIKRITLTLGDNPITFVPFLKSNSMSKENRLYWVNEKYASIINKRVTFDLVKEGQAGILLSKWYAYSGLALSQVRILEDLDLSADEVVVVDDYTVTKNIEAITAISIPMIHDEVKRFCLIADKHGQKDIKERNEIYQKWEAYLSSEDYKNLPTCLLKGSEDMHHALELLHKCIEGRDEYGDEYISIALNSWRSDVVVSQYITSGATKSKDIPWFKFHVKNYPHEINAFDGEGLISQDFANEINAKLGIADNPSNSLQIRLPFIKGVVHACELQLFFKDNGISTIEGIVNFGGETEKTYREYDIKKVKMVLTLSQVKFASFASNLETNPNETQWDCYMRLLNDFEYHLGINNLEPDQNKDGLLNYEFLSTMPLSEKEYDHILEYGKKKFDESLEDKSVYESLDENEKALYEANEELFKTTSFFKSAKNDIFTTLKKDALLTRLPIQSRRLFLSGDLMVLLYSIAGLQTDVISRLKADECYIPNFKGAKRVALLRNPHYSRNEIALLIPTYNNQERLSYFPKLNGVIWVNPMSCIAERLGGADADGDTIIAVYDKIVVNRLFDKLLTQDKDGKIKMKLPIVLIPSLKGGVKVNDHFNRMTCLKNTFSNRAGLISNEAVRFAEYAYATNDYQLHQYVGFYCILGGLEIDSSKTGSRPCFPDIRDLLGIEDKGEIDEISSSKFIKFKDYLTSIKYIDSSLKNGEAKEDGEKKSVGGEISSFLKSSTSTCFNYLVKETKNWKTKEGASQKASWKFAEWNANNALRFFESALVYHTISSMLSNKTKFFTKNNERKAIISSLIRNSGHNESEVDTFFHGAYSDNPIETVKKYCSSEKKYHYMVDDVEKGEFLDNLGIYTSYVSSRKYSDFSNGGYKNLFLSLLYHKYKQNYDSRVNFERFAYSSKEEFLEKESFSWLKKSFINEIGEEELLYALEHTSNEIIRIINILNSGHRNVSYQRQKLALEVSNTYGEFSMPDMNAVLDAKNSDLVLKLHASSYKAYLEETKKGGC